MGSQQVVNKGANLVEIEFRRSVRIKHGSIVNESRISLEDSFDGKFLDVDVGLHQSGKVRRNATDPNRLDPVLIDHTRHLNTAPVGKIFDEIGVRNVRINDTWLASFQTMDDQR